MITRRGRPISWPAAPEHHCGLQDPVGPKPRRLKYIRPAGIGPRPLAPQRIGRDLLSINVTIEIQGSTSGANLRRGSGWRPLHP